MQAMYTLTLTLRTLQQEGPSSNSVNGQWQHSSDFSCTIYLPQNKILEGTAYLGYFTHFLEIYVRLYRSQTDYLHVTLKTDKVIDPQVRQIYCLSTSTRSNIFSTKTTSFATRYSGSIAETMELPTVRDIRNPRCHRTGIKCGVLIGRPTRTRITILNYLKIIPS